MTIPVLACLAPVLCVGCRMVFVLSTGEPGNTLETAVRVTLLGGDFPEEPTGELPLPGLSNHLRGANSSEWVSGVPGEGGRP